MRILGSIFHILHGRGRVDTLSIPIRSQLCGINKANMKSFLIIGDKDPSKKYINKYIEENHLELYNVIRFEEKVLIANAREIKRILSVKQGESDRKLIVIENEITIDAQNALLKSIEELPLNIDLFIVSKNADFLLPTVISRCTIISLVDNKIDSDTPAFVELVEKHYASKNDASPLLLVDRILNDEVRDDTLNEIIASFRIALLNSLKEGYLEKSKRIYTALNRLLKHAPLISNNNVNLRLTLENCL